MPVQGFMFQYQLVTTNMNLNDQNVFKFRFIVLGANPVTINEVITLKLGSALSDFSEDINYGEKTKTQYRITFQNRIDPNNMLLVIQKIPVAPFTDEYREPARK